MKEEGNRLYGGQKIKILEEKHKTIEENKDQKETPIQWILTEEEREIEHAMYMESMTIQPKTVGKGKEKRENSGNTTRVSKRQWRIVSSQLAFSNMYSVLCLEKLGNKVFCQNNTEGVRDVQYTLQLLRKVWMKVGLEKIENHEEIVVKVLLDSRVTGLFIDTKFAKKKGFKLEKLKKPLLV